jgi:ATP phosphoribosyltransferase regulatory subunit
MTDSRNLAAAEEAERRVRDLFAARDFRRVAPPLLQPAGPFVDLSGEDIRNRLYLVSGPDGSESCLRPDFTIPVALEHIAAGHATPAAYSYFGTAVRHRSAASPEFLQAGVESFGRPDFAEADADILALGLDTLRRLDAERVTLRIGDRSLFAAFVQALDVPPAWAERLKRHFGRAEDFRDDLERLEGLVRASGGPSEAFLNVLGGGDKMAARAVVEDLLALAGIESVGGRTAGDIAERFLEQAALSTTSLGAAELALLRQFVSVSAPPWRALDALHELAQDAGVALDRALDALAERLRLLAERDVDLDGATFATAFGRRLDYYTGFVFEAHEPGAFGLGQVLGGGRYDGLLSFLGSREHVPAVGCAVWVERTPLWRRLR